MILLKASFAGDHQTSFILLMVHTTTLTIAASTTCSINVWD